MSVPATNAKNRLLVLYMLSEANMKLSEAQLLRVFSDNNWLSYFDFQLALQALIDSHMVAQREYIQGHFYTITDVGKTTLDFFKKELPHSQREAMAAYCRENRDALEDEARLYTDYYAIGKNQYKVVLKLLEEETTLFEIDLITESKSSAQRYGENWKAVANELYRTCHERLMTGKNKPEE